MKADYKNWMPKGMIMTGAVTGVVLSGTGLSLNVAGQITGKKSLKRLGFLASLSSLAAVVFTVWARKMREAFSYDGKRQMSKQIIEGVADFVKIPDGGTGLDVGCGSGALTIACAKKNPNARMVGVDRWGAEYRDFTKERCEENAVAEGVTNVTFEKGDAVKLPFADETFDAVVSNYVYHNILGKNKQALLRESLRVLKKGGTFAIHDIMSKARYGDMEEFANDLRREGYADVRLIDTTDGMFMSKFEAAWMCLSGSTLLVGTK